MLTVSVGKAGRCACGAGGSLAVAAESSFARLALRGSVDCKAVERCAASYKADRLGAARDVGSATGGDMTGIVARTALAGETKRCCVLCCGGMMMCCAGLSACCGAEAVASAVASMGGAAARGLSIVSLELRLASPPPPWAGAALTAGKWQQKHVRARAAASATGQLNARLVQRCPAQRAVERAIAANCWLRQRRALGSTTRHEPRRFTGRGTLALRGRRQPCRALRRHQRRDADGIGKQPANVCASNFADDVARNLL